MTRTPRVPGRSRRAAHGRSCASRSYRIAAGSQVKDSDERRDRRRDSVDFQWLLNTHTARIISGAGMRRSRTGGLFVHKDAPFDLVNWWLGAIR